MICDMIPPANRTFCNSFNNLVYFFARLTVVICNAFIFPYIPGVYSSTDNYITYSSSMKISAVAFIIGFIVSFFVNETCP